MPSCAFLLLLWYPTRLSSPLHAVNNLRIEIRNEEEKIACCCCLITVGKFGWEFRFLLINFSYSFSLGFVWRDVLLEIMIFRLKFKQCHNFALIAKYTEQFFHSFSRFIAVLLFVFKLRIENTSEWSPPITKIDNFQY